MTGKTQLKTRTTEYDYLDDGTNEYVKYTVQEEQQIRFYLAPFGKWFTPCKEDQEKLNHILETTDILYVLGSTKSITIEREYIPEDGTEEEVERRPPTEGDFKKLFDWNHWEKAWKDYQESLKE